MRVPSSLPYTGVGMALFAALGFAAPAQQVQRQAQPSPQNVKAELAPTRLTLRPTQAEWSELVQIQASLSPANRIVNQPVEDVEKATASETIDDIVLPEPFARMKRQMQPTPPTGGIERLGGCTGFSVIPPASLSTIGQTDGPDSFASLFYPANPAGGVGPDHLMVMAPNFTLIQDKLGGTISSIDTITFWAPTAATLVRYCRLDYDAVNGRWHATALGGSGIGGTSILFAISDTDDPTGSWDFYSITADPGATTFADNLKKGYNQTWIVVTAEMYTSTAAAGTAGSRLYTFDVASALAGGPVVTNTFSAGYVTALTGQGSPVVNWRNVPTRSLDGSLAEIHLVNARLATAASPVWQMIQITGTGVAPVLAPYSTSVFGPNPATASLFFIPFDYTNSRQGVLQVGDARLIDPIPPDGTLASTRARLSDIVVRNGKLFAVHNHGLPAPATAAATRNGLGFYEMDPALGIDGGTGVGPFTQQVQIDDGINTSIVHPSIAVNCAEDVLIGFSRSDLTKNIEAGYCMRLGSDAPNTMGPTTTLKAGESSWWQLNPAPSTIGAWGYYSSSAIDPDDDETLWTLQPYAATRVGGADADSRWGTWWGRFCGYTPVITDQPDDVPGACAGDLGVSFSVTVTSALDPITYQWRLDGMDIPGATSSSYTIPVVATADEGTYDVVVGGCVAIVSDPADLELNEPAITTQPQDYFAKLGEPAAFYVVAAPFLGSLSYQWYHEATPVGVDDDILAIGPVTPFDYGNYTCVITDSCGVATTEVARLLPPGKDNNHLATEVGLAIIDHPQSLELCDGSQAVFAVNATVNGLPGSATYVWRYNGSPIVPPETNSTLVLNAVTPAENGIYDVVVSLGSKSKASLPATLNVIDVPVITMQPGPPNQSLPPGSDVSYTVTVAPGGTILYQWQKKPTTPFAPFANVPGANGPYIGLEDITADDAGTYRCRISNECGFLFSNSCRLIVL